MTTSMNSLDVPLPDDAERVIYEGHECTIMAPQDYEALWQAACDWEQRCEQAEADALRWRLSNEEMRNTLLCVAAHLRHTGDMTMMGRIDQALGTHLGQEQE